VVVDGQTGLLVGQPIDPAELLDALCRLMADPALTRRFGEAGWARVADQFNARAHQARVAGLVRPLLDRLRPTGDA